MRRASLIAAVCALSALSGMADAKTRHTAPQAKMTDEQIDQVVEEVFKKADVNHDDRLSRIELTTYGFDRRLGVAVRSKLWNRMDADRDGRISKGELHDYMKRYDNTH